MYRFFLFALLLLVSLPSQSYDKNSCELDFLDAEWIGEFNFYSGTTHLMKMKVNKVKNCKISGEFSWPSYFNSVTTYEGKLQGDTLVIKEVMQLQGYYMNLDDALYKIKLTSTDTLTGLAYNKGREVATIKIYKANAAAKGYLENFREQEIYYAQKFGITRILGTSKEKFKAVKNKYSDRTANNTISTNLRISGTMYMNKISLPYFFIYKPANNYYMEMSFQNLTFRQWQIFTSKFLFSSAFKLRLYKSFSNRLFLFVKKLFHQFFLFFI